MAAENILIRALSDVTDDHRSGVIAIGNFDGVHRGHQKVIEAARTCADKLECQLGAMVFDPHPVKFFNPEVPPFRLTRIEKRAALLREAGTDFTLALNFNKAIAELDARAFIDQILVQALDVKAVVIGHDFHFGAKRSGSPELLAAIGRELGFEVVVVAAAHRDNAPTPFSSSEIREALARGDLKAATRWLGHPWSIDGEVARGDQRGRTIGFPTANIELDDFTRPAFGVYAVRAQFLDGHHRSEFINGVANIGMRPTVGTLAPRLEVHLFDFADDLYGQWLDVSLLHFIRPEQKFDGLEALKLQIAKDSETARQILKNI